MDIEGFVRKEISKKTDEKIIESILSERILEFKNITKEKSSLIAKTVIDEVKITLEFKNNSDKNLKELIEIPNSDVSMGEIGVGSRGSGDFFVHRKIAEIIESTNIKSVVNPTAQDDGGVVKISKTDDNIYVTTAIDGIHSRLSEYPFLGGFHVTRATLRDICVMGSEPVAILSDIHLGDDGDVGKILDFTAGISAVSELIDVPIVAGSTLRIGGDMVLGNRLVSAVGSVGVSKDLPTARKRAEVGDIILMTEGSGGGTITTTALYNGYFDVIWETMNINFIKASQALFESDLIQKIHSMTDVTNGGLRGDAYEISQTTGLGLKFYEDKVKSTVSPKVLNMLKDLEIDPLGISTDSLLLIVPPEHADEIKTAIENKGVPVKVVGEVDDTGKPRIIKDNSEEENLIPLFREAAYTKIKKVVGEDTPKDFELMKNKVQKATNESIKKKEKVIEHILNNN